MRGIWQPQIRGHSCQLQHIIVINLLNNLDERVNLFSLWKTGINWIQINSFIAKGEFDQTKKTSKSWTKPKGETTQMKGLDEYFVMAECSRCYWTEFEFLQILCLIWTRETWQWKG